MPIWKPTTIGKRIFKKKKRGFLEKKIKEESSHKKAGFKNMDFEKNLFIDGRRSN